MGKMTFVVEFEDGKEPPVTGGMTMMGGELIRVAWRDAIEDMDEMELNHLSEMERIN
jgi:hypothetical protein